jgi:hypothetical protein
MKPAFIIILWTTIFNLVQIESLSADESLTKSKAIEMVMKNPGYFKILPLRFRKDKDIVLAAVEQSAWLLEYADDSLKKDKNFMLDAIDQNLNVLEYADDSLKKDESFMFSAVIQDGNALRYADDSLKKRPDHRHCRRHTKWKCPGVCGRFPEKGQRCCFFRRLIKMDAPSDMQAIY